MAGSIFAIHLLGDLWSPKIVGMLSDKFGDLQKAVLLLPCALVFSAGFWLWLAIRQSRRRTDGQTASSLQFASEIQRGNG